MRPLAFGTALWVAVLALAGLSCDPPQSPPETLVPMVTVYPPLSVAQTTTQAPLREDLETTTTTTMPLPLVGPDTPCQEWLPLATQVGWPEDRDMVEKLLSIMWRESRCQPGAVNQTDPNGGSLGLLQINQFWCKPSKYTDNGWLQDMGILDDCQELYDPATNLRAGLAMYSYSVYKNGDGWHPWRT